MTIAYVVQADFTGLDLIGPHEIISRWPEADVRSHPRHVREGHSAPSSLAMRAICKPVNWTP